MTRPVNTILAISIIVVLAAVIGGIIWWQFSQQAEDIAPTSEQTNQQQEIQQVNNQQQEQGAQKCSQTAKGPKELVWEYYNPATKKYGHGLDLNYVTQKFIDDYNRRFEEAKKSEMGGFGYSPISCAQDYPDDLSKATIKVKSESEAMASVSVSLFTDWRPFIVKLVKQNCEWRINEIKCN